MNKTATKEPYKSSLSTEETLNAYLEEYRTEITKLINKSYDISLLDLIYKILCKSVA